MIKYARPEIQLENGYLKGKRVIWIKFKYDPNLIRIVGRIQHCRWNYEKKAWYIPFKHFDQDHFVKIISNKARINITMISMTNTSGLHIQRLSETHSPKLPDGFLDLLQQKRYSKSTIKIYSSYFSQYQEYFANDDLKQISTDQINAYIVELINNLGISSSQQNQRINAIKFYYEKVLGRTKAYYKVERPKKARKLPTVLSKNEVNLLLNITGNLKHKCILTTIYSSGLRRSELINLKVEDIDSQRSLIRIQAAKGKKDRYTLLSEKLILLLREYYKAYRPKVWLFEGQNGGKYSTTSVAKIVKSAVKKAGIQKHVTPHCLRHSFATHLLEQGTNLRYIQEILGHEDPKTTQIYTRVATNELSNIRSPFDDFD
jgi:integrase/recombinase XerD